MIEPSTARIAAALLAFALNVPLIFSHGAERVALVVGNSDYAQAPLGNPGNDSVAMSRVFRDLGFQVIEKKNLERREFSAAIRQLSASVDREGIALFYFAGHGLQVKGENFLMPIGADVKEEFDVPDECISLDRVLSAMEASESGLNIVFLDCCRNNPYKRGWRRSNEKGLAQTLVPEGTLISFAAAPGKEALDGTGKNSPFTEALLAVLPTPGLTLTDALMAARKHVYDATRREQRPWISHDLLDKVVLKDGVPPPPPTEEEKLRAKIASMGKLIEELEAKGQSVETLKEQLSAMEAEQAKEKESAVVMSSSTSEASLPEDLSRGFTNTLGMRFVPVGKTGVLFCEHETRVQDYAVYAAEKSGVNMEWKKYEHLQTGDHPVLNVNWDDAKAFCAWLSQKEGITYRLPTDHEWSVAVGIGGMEDRNASPEAKNVKIEGYPWGSAWPPPEGAGNFSGSEAFSQLKIPGYTDPHPFSAPVKSYVPNRFGLYDLSGNVWEWCEDWINREKEGRVLRGGGWSLHIGGFFLRSSFRASYDPASRSNIHGFRCVVDLNH